MKTKPKPRGNPARQGPTQVSRLYDVQAKMNMLIGINQQLKIIGMSLSSGGGKPVCLARKDK